MYFQSNRHSIKSFKKKFIKKCISKIDRNKLTIDEVFLKRTINIAIIKLIYY